LITPIEEAWATNSEPQLTRYPAGSEGPKEAEELVGRNRHRWRKLEETVSGCD
jgi:glucose-6-phosphate 1-dehydrogenase